MKPNNRAVPQPDQQTISRMLDDVEAVTKARFYEDPEPIASPVEMFRMPEGKPGGQPFSALSGREKLQVLDFYTDWSDYEKAGVGFDAMEQVFSNVIDGKPREQWLEGSGLDKPLPDGKTDLMKLQEKAVEQLQEVLRQKANAQEPRAKQRDLDMER